MPDVPEWLVAALFIGAAVAIILFIPDRHKPWWERRDG